MRFSSFNSLKYYTNWPKEAWGTENITDQKEVINFGDNYLCLIPEGLLLSTRNQLAQYTFRRQSDFSVLLVSDLKRGKKDSFPQTRYTVVIP